MNTLYVCFPGSPEVKFSFWSRVQSCHDQVSRICSYDFMDHVRPADDHGLNCMYHGSVATVLPCLKMRN